MEQKTDVCSTFNLALYEEILSRGLCKGQGFRHYPDGAPGQVCIEAALCWALDLTHNDDPGCVSAAVRSFKISINDVFWSTSEARAKGLHDIGLAQLGSLGVVSDIEFLERLSEKIIRVLIPKLFRQVLTDKASLDAATRCENEGTKNAAFAAHHAAYNASDASYVAASAASACNVADYAAANAAAYAAASAAAAANAAAANAAASAVRHASAAAFTAHDEYLILGVQLALEVLRELNSPGIALLDRSKSGAKV